MSISWWATVRIMFGSNRRKMRQIADLVVAMEEHRQKYLEAQKKLRELTGIP